MGRDDSGFLVSIAMKNVLANTVSAGKNNVRENIEPGTCRRGEKNSTWPSPGTPMNRLELAWSAQASA